MNGAAPRPLVRIIRSEEGLVALRDQWRELFAQSGTANFFASPDWVLLGRRHFDRGEIHTFAVYDEQGLAGLFPLVRCRSGLPGLGLRELSFVYHMESAKPQWLLRGPPEPVLASLIDELLRRPGWDVIRLWDTPSDAPGLAEFKTLLTARGLIWWSRPRPGALTMTVGDDYRALWSGLSRNLRRKITRLTNRAERGAPLRMIVSRPGDDPGQWMQRLLGVAAHSWKSALGTSLADAARPAFYTEALRHFLPSGRARLYLLAMGDTDVAYYLGFIQGGVYYCLKTDYDHRFAEHSPGNILLARMVEHLSGDPEVRSIDFIVTLPFTERWADGAAPLEHFTLYRPNLIGRTLGAIEPRWRPLLGQASRCVLGGLNPSGRRREARQCHVASSLPDRPRPTPDDDQSSPAG